MQMSGSTKELATALAKAQAEIKGAIKDANNPFFKSKYADLSSVVEAIKVPFSKNGLSYVQAVQPSNKDEVCVETYILHSSGEWLGCGILAVPVSKADAQGYGSALTYARRYGLSAAAGVAPEDDDGNAAAKSAPITPSTGAFESLTAKQQSRILDIAIYVKELLAESKVAEALHCIEGANPPLEVEEKLGLWIQFDSKQRSLLKRQQEAERKNEDARVQ